MSPFDRNDLSNAKRLLKNYFKENDSNKAFDQFSKSQMTLDTIRGIPRQITIEDSDNLIAELDDIYIPVDNAEILGIMMGDANITLERLITRVDKPNSDLQTDADFLQQCHEYTQKLDNFLEPVKKKIREDKDKSNPPQYKLKIKRDVKTLSLEDAACEILGRFIRYIKKSVTKNPKVQPVRSRV